MIALRLLLVLAWIPAQLLGLLVGGFGMAGGSMGERGTGLLGLLILVAPTAIPGGALVVAGRNPASAKPVLLGATILLVLGMITYLLVVRAARPG